MSLKERLLTDMHSAMRQRDKDRVSVLRLLRSSVNYQEKNEQKDLDDLGVVEVIAKEARQRREAIDMYLKANRPDRAGQESRELEIVQEYLPDQLTSEEITNLVQIAINEICASTPKDKGRVMSLIMPRLKGKADGAVVSQIVTKMLEGLVL